MTHANAIDKLSLRLNKLYSQDYNDIDLYKISEAINKACNDIIRRLLKGNNLKKEGDEETSFTIDDLAVLLKTKKETPKNKEDLFSIIDIPEDYRYFKRITPFCSKGNCYERIIKSKFIEEANVDDYLLDYNTSPSFDFEETFHTEFGKTFKIFHNNDFKIDNINITYYRNPKYLDIENETSDTIWEFKDDLCELIIDEAVKNLAGDTENILQHQLSEKRLEINI